MNKLYFAQVFEMNKFIYNIIKYLEQFNNITCCFGQRIGDDGTCDNPHVTNIWAFHVRDNKLVGKQKLK